MARFSMMTMVLVGLLAGSAASAHAGSKDKKDHKDKGHKFIGLSPVDFPHKDHGGKDCNGRDHHGKDHHGKDRCGKDHCGNDHCGDSCHHGSKPTQFYPGGSKNGPPGTPENPTQPVTTTPPKTPIKYYGLNNKNLLGSLKQGANRPGGPGSRPAPSQGQIPTLGTGFNGFAGAVGKTIGSTVGMGVTEALKGVGSVANAVGDLAGGVASAAGDLASAAGNALESLL